MTIAVLGAGLSGLSISRHLAKKGHSVVCFEAKSRVGGWVSSERTPIVESIEGDSIGGVLFEKGPHSLRPRSEGNGLRLVELLYDLGLDKEAICSQGSNRYIWLNGKLMKLPNRLVEVFQHPLTRSIPLHLLRDLFSIQLQPPDESIGSFFERKLGPEAKPLFTAMVGGIFAGNVDALSMHSCFPQLIQLQKKGRGSLVRGMMFSRSTPPPSNNMTRLLKASSISFPNGMHTLVHALHRECMQLGVDIRLETPVQRILENPNNSGPWKVNGECFSHVVSTLPPKILAQSLGEGEGASLLNQFSTDFIGSVNVVVVNLSYAKEQIPLLPSSSFGHLMADVQMQSESGCLGVLYDSSAFPQQQPKDKVVFSVMLGGANAAWVTQPEYSEGDWIQLAQAALKHHLFVTALPLESSASKHVDCIPQYRVGHSQAARHVEKVFRDRGMFVLGTGFLGVGIADSVGGGLLTMEQVKL